ncbi:hypothetical protein LINPERHAP2_LOCUS18985 [Linum perenne]
MCLAKDASCGFFKWLDVAVEMEGGVDDVVAENAKLKQENTRLRFQVAALEEKAKAMEEDRKQLLDALKVEDLSIRLKRLEVEVEEIGNRGTR